MKIWKITAPRALELREEREDMGEGCVKVRLNKVVLDSTDLNSYFGSNGAAYPLAPGRLAMGVVSETSDETFERCQRVAVSPYLPCGVCDNCREGKTCREPKLMGQDCDGFLRDFVVLPKSCVHEFPEHISDNEAVFADYIAVALKTLDRLAIEKGQQIAVLGASGIGLMLAQLAIYYQGIPILIDSHQDRLDTAREAGVYYTVNSGLADVNKKIIEITGGRLCEKAAYTSASDEKPQKAFALTAKGGMCALVGSALPVNDAWSVNVAAAVSKSLTVFGVSDGAGYTSRAVNMLATEAVKVKGIVTAGASMSNAAGVLQNVSSGSNAVICFNNA